MSLVMKGGGGDKKKGICDAWKGSGSMLKGLVKGDATMLCMALEGSNFFFIQSFSCSILSSYNLFCIQTFLYR